MAKNTLSEKDFMSTLRASREGTESEGKGSVATPATAPGGMKLNRPPSGPKISTDELYEQEQSRERQAVEAKTDSKAEEALEGLPTLDVIRKIPLHQIVDSPYQPRLIYDPIGLDSLGESLLAGGQVEPITVRVVGEKFELLGGHRRTRAARNIGWTEIEARIKACDDYQAEKIALLQNEGREDLSEYERGKVYHRAQERGFAKTQAEVAKLFGCHQSTVSNCLKLLTLPDEIKSFLEANPNAFGFALGRVIFDLLKAYPDELPLLVEGTERIVNGAEASSFRNWFLMRLASRSRTGKRKEKSIVTGKSGKTLFSATYEKGKVQIKLAEGLKVDEETVQRWIVAALRERAEQAYDDQNQ